MATSREGQVVLGPLPEESLFGRWLRRRRKALDLTQRELADRVGCSESTVRKLEADVRHPSRRVASRLADVLDIAREERPAFVRFALRGWVDRPPPAAGSEADRPWLPHADAPGLVEGPRARAPEGATVPDSVVATTTTDGGERSVLPLFGRSIEMAELEGHLSAALQGKGGVVFVVGEAGQGKTAVLRALVARAQAKDRSLLATAGSCNAYTGTGDPFLPFREVLEELSWATEPEGDPAALEGRRTERLRRFAPQASRILREEGPNLFGTVLPQQRLASWASAASTAHGLPVGDPERLEAEWLVAPLPSGRQAALRSELARSLRRVATEVPLLLVLDDLQWIDRSSAELLMFLANTIRDDRFLIVGAFRPPDTPEPGARDGVPFAHALLGELVGMQGTPIIDLDGAEGRRFVEELLDSEPNDLGVEFREALWRQTAGHPLFTTELLRALRERGDLVRDDVGRWSASPHLRWDQLPDRVAGVIGERIARVGPFAREVLRAASVVGEIFTAEVLAVVLRRDASDVVSVLEEELGRAHRVVEPVAVERGPVGLRSRYRFRHILIQQHVYRQIGEGARSYLHEAVPEALEAVLGEDAEPLAVALHWIAAKMPARAVPYLRQAGDRARRAGAVAEAIEHITAALEHGAELRPLARAALLRDLGECYHWRADRASALLAFEEARALFVEHGDVRSAGAVEATMGHVLWEGREVARALEVTEAAIASLEAGSETPELAMALVTLAMIQRVYSHDAEALSYAQRALDVAARVGSEVARMRALVWVGVVLASTDPARHDEGLAMIEEAKAIAERQGAVWWVSLAANQLGSRLRALGRFEQAVERLETATAYAEKHELPLNANFSFSELWSHRWQRGEWDVALTKLPRLEWHVQGEGALAMLQAGTLVHLVEAYLDLGLVEEAHAVLDGHVGDLDEVDEPQVRVPYLRERLRIAILQADEEAADRHAFRLIECLAGRSTHSEEVPVPVVTVCRWLARRPSRNAKDGLGSCLLALAQAERQFASDLTRAAQLEGRAAAAGGGGRPREAAQLFVAAADGWASCGFPLYEARARCSAATCLERLGAAEDADSARRRADGLLHALQDRLPAGTFRSAFQRVREAMITGRSV